MMRCSTELVRSATVWMAIAVGALIAAAPATARDDATGGAVFDVRFENTARAEPATGRLVVYLVRDGSRIGQRAAPARGPFFSDPQPMFGVDVRAMAPGDALRIDDGATSFPSPPSALPLGRYRAQAVLDHARADSSWYREPGNLYSEVVEFEVVPDKRAEVSLDLTNVVAERAAPRIEGAEIFEMDSELLRSFRGMRTTLRAMVILPESYDPERSYAAVYVAPGFGGTHMGGTREAMRRRSREGLGARDAELARNVFIIHLDPEGPNGHHLFADSENNGPVGSALVRELIPALERTYPLIARPEARIVTGHSSGGWSSLWLTLTYPQTFGACWSSAPDPVDFRRFQLTNLYKDANMYRTPAARAGVADAEGPTIETPSRRDGARVTMTVREENLMEEVLGPGNTSAQQWDSWLAAFGPRDAAGNPAAMFDPISGKIDHEVAGRFARYDIGALLREDPQRLAPLLRERVRLIVGDRDNYYLNEAVSLLHDDLNRLAPRMEADVPPGSIRFVAGADHGSELWSREELAQEMLEHLARCGLIDR